MTRDVLVAGKPLAAGTYSLFTTPGPDTWTVHFNSRLGLDGAVHWLGPQPHDRVALACQAADVLALPSSVEGFGLPILESRLEL